MSGNKKRTESVKKKGIFWAQSGNDHVKKRGSPTGKKVNRLREVGLKKKRGGIRK